MATPFIRNRPPKPTPAPPCWFTKVLTSSALRRESATHQRRPRNAQRESSHLSPKFVPLVSLLPGGKQRCQEPFPQALGRRCRAEQTRAGDSGQRPLVPRSRCPPRLTRSVRQQVVMTKS